MTDPQRILIVRLGALGDIIHALPVLASLRAQWPGADIDWLVASRHAGLLDLVPGLANRVVIDTRQIRGEQGWVRTVRRLRERRYDLAIDVQGLIKSAVLARGAGAREVIGFAGGQVRERPAALLYGTRVDPRPAQHVIDCNLALAAHAGVTMPRREFNLRVPPPGEATDHVLERLGASFTVLNPGGGWPNKRWPADRFGELASRIARTSTMPMLAIWGQGERHLAEAVAAAAPHAVWMAPPTALDDLVAILARATLLVSGDSGPLHIAAALGTPVVGIFGPTNPARNGPWMNEDVCVSRSDRCECSHQRRCRAAHWCLADVGVADVEDAVTRRLVEASGK